MLLIILTYRVYILDFRMKEKDPKYQNILAKHYKIQNFHDLLLLLKKGGQLGSNSHDLLTADFTTHHHHQFMPANQQHVLASTF